MAISDIVKNAGERQLRELAEAGVRARQALRGGRERAGKRMGEAIGTAEAGFSAFGFGCLRGRYGSEGELSVLGVPVDLAVALGPIVRFRRAGRAAREARTKPPD